MRPAPHIAAPGVNCLSARGLGAPPRIGSLAPSCKPGMFQFTLIESRKRRITCLRRHDNDGGSF